jgi:hypothetical protein
MITDQGVKLRTCSFLTKSSNREAKV